MSDMFTVVQHQERCAVMEDLRHSIGERSVRLLSYTKNIGHCLRDELWVTEAGQPYEPHPVGMLVENGGRYL
jgi:hypothetical protein